MLKRMRKLKLKSKEKLVTIKQKAERRDNIRMEKAEKMAKVDLNIEKELIDRLQMGVHQELYEDILNWNKTAFDQLLAAQQVEQDQDISEEIEDEIENNLEFVFNQNNIDPDEDDDEEEKETKDQKKKKKIKKQKLQKRKKIELLMEEEDEILENELQN